MGNEINSPASSVDAKIKGIDKDIRKLIKENKGNFIGLLGGNTGLVLYYFYMGKYFNKNSYYKEGIALLEEIINKINNSEFIDCKFSSGLSGLGWTLCHIREHFPEVIDINESLLQELDDSIIRFMYENLGERDYDYLHNGLGPVMYLMHSNDPQKVTPHLKNVSVLLINMLERISKEKYVWRGYYDKTEPGAINYGLSHGFPSILVILSKLYKSGYLGKEVIEPIRHVCNFLLAHKQTTKNSIFPYNSYFKKTDSRLAWCYGDLGVGIALHHANQVVKDQRIEEKIIQIFKHSAQRLDLEKNRVYDAGLCHGSAGIALIFLLMSRQYPIPEFQETAYYWLDKTLDFSSHPDGLGGYKAFIPNAEINYENNYGFLEGVSGIALAMSAFKNDFPTDWTEVLLLS